MAIITKRVAVCDEGLEKCDNTVLHKVRITVDGKSRAATLCNRHVAPWEKLRSAGRSKPSRGRIYSISEIEAQRRA